MRERLRLEHEEALIRLAVYEAQKTKGERYMKEAAEASIAPPSDEELALINGIIERSRKRKRAEAFRKKARKVLGRAAVFVMTAVTVCFALVMSVDALRAQFVSFLITFTPEYTELRLEETDPTGTLTEAGESIYISNQYTPTYIPEGFVLHSMNILEGDIRYVYQNIAEDTIIFDASFGSTIVAHINTEDADFIRTVDINGSQGLFVKRKDIYTVAWTNEEGWLLEILSQSNEEETLAMARSIVLTK